MRLVNVEGLKTKLGMEDKEVISYGELLEACEGMGVARSREEAVAFARVLDDAGVVLLFRDKVYLHPDKVCPFTHSFLLFMSFNIFTCILKTFLLHFFFSCILSICNLHLLSTNSVLNTMEVAAC